MSKSENLDFSKDPLSNPDMKDIISSFSTRDTNKYQAETISNSTPSFLLPVVHNTFATDSNDKKEDEAEKAFKRKLRLFKKKRCYICEKKTGLLGFECRCDTQVFFCSAHRQDHNCSFDFKAHDRNIIAKNNQMVRASKIEKI